jgi:hypothetical protein
VENLATNACVVSFPKQGDKMNILKDVVNGISLGFIETQLDLEHQIPEWLEEEYDSDEVEELDFHEVMLRAIVVNAKDAEAELKEEYGILDASLYPEED